MMSLVLALALGAPPPSVEQCLASSEEGQRRRAGRELLHARTLFTTCSAPACPAVVRADCQKWLFELRAEVPSVIIAAREDDRDHLDAVMTVDGAPAERRLDGSPLEVDPGAHRLVVRLSDGRRHELAFVAVIGEQNRRIVLRVQPRSPTPSAPDETRRSPVLPILLTVGTVGAVATFAGLGLVGSSQLRDLEALPCASTKTCDPRQVEPTRALLIGADVSLGVAIVLAGLSVWQWWAWADAPVAVTWEPRSQQLGLVFSRRF